MTAKDQNLEELLDEATLCARAGELELDRVRELRHFAQQRGQSLVAVLVERGGVSEEKLLAGLAALLGLPLANGEINSIPDDVLRMVSPAVAIRHQAMPLGLRDGRLRVTCWDPFDWTSWDELAHLLGRPIEKVLCPRPAIDRLLKLNYGLGADTVERLVADRADTEVQLLGPVATDLSDEEAANEPTVVNLVNQIFSEAIRAGATDVHFEPYEDRLRVRYRIDGMLDDVAIPASARALKSALVSRIKIMSGLDITEKRLPQDGRAQVSLAGQTYDLRVSILPGVYGEAVVIRLQSQQMIKLDVGTLGFASPEEQRIRHLIERPHGLMLVTGPTGSGKTTTLYSCLHAICHPENKIITIEDPVEYWMDDILQMQVQQEIGFTFARALRSMLRHDPDVMLVGEIRDLETAEIAVRSALTGHLVFATLHTNDAAGAMTRLIDIGIEPFLVASSVHGVLAQRLVRKICPHCRRRRDGNELSPAEEALCSAAGVASDDLWEGAGCERCRFTGFRGRTAIGEVLLVTPALRRLVQQRESTEAIQHQACEEGMRTLRYSALQALKAGTTTLTEVQRVTQEDT
ncbi:MAG: GspE/PulE family protein [Planctomycetota bacterium]